MRSIALALVVIAGCSSAPPLDDLGAADDLAAPDLGAAPDLAPAGDLSGCGPGCATADFVAEDVTVTCPSQIRGKVCNRGTIAGGTVAAFYYSNQTSGFPLPAFDRSKSTLVCKIAVVTLAPGGCTTTGCAPSAGFTGIFPTGDYWMRANDDGQTFPLAAECCPSDDVAGTFIDCTLP